MLLPVQHFHFIDNHDMHVKLWSLSALASRAQSCIHGKSLLRKMSMPGIQVTIYDHNAHLI